MFKSISKEEFRRITAATANSIKLPISEYDDCGTEGSTEYYSSVTLDQDIGPYKKGSKVDTASYNFKSKVFTIINGRDVNYYLV